MGKRPQYHDYITRGLYNWGRSCPLTGDIHLAFDRPIPATETAGAPAAQAAATAALEAVFARCVSAQMVIPPPPRFSSPARNRAALFRLTHAGLCRVAARAERTPLPDSAPNSLRERARPPADGRRPSAVSHTSRSSPSTLHRSERPSVPRLQRRRWLMPAIPIDGGPATAMHNTHQEEKR